jgi:hypothetical protein
MGHRAGLDAVAKRKMFPPESNPGYKDYVKMNLREIGFVGVNCIQLAMKRVQLWAYVNTVMNLWVLYKHRNS